jgi:hypothetical protein
VLWFRCRATPFANLAKQNVTGRAFREETLGRMSRGNREAISSAAMLHRILRITGGMSNGPVAARSSRKIHREAFEIGECTIFQRARVSRTQHHAGCLTQLERFPPAGRAQAPTITGF